MFVGGREGGKRVATDRLLAVAGKKQQNKNRVLQTRTAAVRGVDAVFGVAGVLSRRVGGLGKWQQTEQGMTWCQEVVEVRTQKTRKVLFWAGGGGMQ